MVAVGKPKVTFKVAPGARIRRGDVQVIGETLERLKSKGVLSAETVLEEASNPKSPLHKYFSWNDQEAAHAYRLEQARRLIRAIEIEVQDARGKSVQLRQFYSVKDSRGQRSYEPIEFVFSDAAMTDQVMREAKQQLDGWMAKFRKYQWAKAAVPQVAAALRALRQATKKSKK